MTVASAQVTVTSSPTLLVAGTHGSSTVPIQATVRNTDTTLSVFVGALGVTTGTGFELIAGAAETVDLVAGDDLYGRAASTPVRVDVLQTRG